MTGLAELSVPGHPFFAQVVQEAEKNFEDEIKKSRLHKLHNLSQFFLKTLPLKGRVAECGVWRGLSSYFLCRYAQRAEPSFDGSGFDLFDSFEGLPPPQKEDESQDREVEGKFRASLSEVRGLLGEFPNIRTHAGCFHRTFPAAESSVYRFVHVDADLYRSTREALEYFYPRLEPLGVLVCDDYGDVKWPGVRKAVDEYAERHSIAPLSLSTRQAVFLKVYGSNP